MPDKHNLLPFLGNIVITGRHSDFFKQRQSLINGL